MKTSLLVSLFMCMAQGLWAKDKASLPTAVPFNLDEIKIHQKTQEQKKSTSTFYARISGQVTATAKSSLSFRVPGFIETIAKKPGDSVKKGEVIATLDATDYDLAFKLMKLNLEQARLSEQAAKNEYDRELQLKEAHASTASQFDVMETKYKQAKVAAELAALNMKNAERNLDLTKLKAPYDCVLANQSRDIAEHVNLDTRIFDIYERSLEVTLNAPEILVGKITVGSKLLVSIPSINFKDEALVTRVVPAISESTRTFRVTAVFQQKNARIVPGLFVEAELK